MVVSQAELELECSRKLLCSGEERRFTGDLARLTMIAEERTCAVSSGLFSLSALVVKILNLFYTHCYVKRDQRQASQVPALYLQLS